MSYDIDFWRYKRGVSSDHQAVYQALSAGQQVEGLEDLPLSAILARLQEVLPGWKLTDGETWESHGRIFQIYTTPQFFRVACYDLSEEEINAIIAALGEFGCPLYDPQVGKRYESS
jgi:hypothetical protein